MMQDAASASTTTRMRRERILWSYCWLVLPASHITGDVCASVYSGSRSILFSPAATDAACAWVYVIASAAPFAEPFVQRERERRIQTSESLRSARSSHMPYESIESLLP